MHEPNEKSGKVQSPQWDRSDEPSHGWWRHAGKEVKKKSVQNCYMTKWRRKLVHEDVKSKKKKILKTMCEKLDLIEYRAFLENVRIWCNGLHFLGCFIGMSKKISKYFVIFFKVTMEKIPTEEHHRIFP